MKMYSAQSSGALTPLPPSAARQHALERRDRLALRRARRGGASRRWPGLARGTLPRAKHDLHGGVPADASRRSGRTRAPRRPRGRAAAPPAPSRRSSPPSARRQPRARMTSPSGPSSEASSSSTLRPGRATRALTRERLDRHRGEDLDRHAADPGIPRAARSSSRARASSAEGGPACCALRVPGAAGELAGHGPVAVQPSRTRRSRRGQAIACRSHASRDIPGARRGPGGGAARSPSCSSATTRSCASRPPASAAPTCTSTTGASRWSRASSSATSSSARSSRRATA